MLARNKLSEYGLGRFHRFGKITWFFKGLGSAGFSGLDKIRV